LLAFKVTFPPSSASDGIVLITLTNY